MSAKSAAEMFAPGKIVQLLKDERAKALSRREWQHRIAGYGYAVQKTDAGQFVTAMLGGAILCALPQDLWI